LAAPQTTTARSAVMAELTDADIDIALERGRRAAIAESLSTA
jgi:hypothetical protein